MAELITRGCNTDLPNHRGKTAWDIAIDYAKEDVLAVFRRFSEDTLHKHEQLHQEGIRRARRPAVKDTFRDDIQLDPVRLDLWSIEPFNQWSKVAEGTFGTVFEIIALALARAGCSAVAIVDIIDDEATQEVVTLINESGSSGSAIIADLSTVAAIRMSAPCVPVAASSHPRVSWFWRVRAVQRAR